MKRLVFIVALALFPATSYAEGSVVSAGKPDLETVSPVSNENVSDIYTRQIEYLAERMEFRRIMDQRQQSFARPRIQAINAYEAKLQTLNASRQDWRGETQ